MNYQDLVNIGQPVFQTQTTEAECMHDEGIPVDTTFPRVFIRAISRQGEPLKVTHLGISQDTGAREGWAPPRLNPFLFLASGHSLCFFDGHSPFLQMGMEFQSEGLTEC